MKGRGAQAPAITQALARARSFVETHGSVLGRERFARLVDDAPVERVEAVLGTWRCEDGGFAPVSEPAPLLPVAGTLSGALEALGVFDEADVRRGPRIEGLVAWIARAQRDDGAWEPAASETRAPADVDPVYVTGMLAGHLAKLPCGSARTLARAEEFLAAHFSPDVVEGGDWRRLTAYAQVCTNGAFEGADEVLQWCGRALEKGFRSGQLSALDVARTLLLCDVRALPASRVDAATVVLAILPAQHADGSFGDGDRSTAERVDATLLGVRTLVRFGAEGAAWTAV